MPNENTERNATSSRKSEQPTKHPNPTAEEMEEDMDVRATYLDMPFGD